MNYTKQTWHLNRHGRRQGAAEAEEQRAEEQEAEGQVQEGNE